MKSYQRLSVEYPSNMQDYLGSIPSTARKNKGTNLIESTDSRGEKGRSQTIDSEYKSSC